MTEITIKFQSSEVTVKQNKDGLYRLNDVAYAALSGVENHSSLSALTLLVRDRLNGLTKSLSPRQVLRFEIKKVRGGKWQGTYSNEKGVRWLLSKLEEVQDRAWPQSLYVIGVDEVKYVAGLEPLHNRCRSTHYFKIGIANDPEKRLLQLQGSNPLPLKLYGSVALPEARAYEKYLHTLLKESRNPFAGEWFELCFFISTDTTPSFATVYPEEFIALIVAQDKDKMEFIVKEHEEF